jgi:hypothetical protein
MRVRKGHNRLFLTLGKSIVTVAFIRFLQKVFHSFAKLKGAGCFVGIHNFTDDPVIAIRNADIKEPFLMNIYSVAFNFSFFFQYLIESLRIKFVINFFNSPILVVPDLYKVSALCAGIALRTLLMK